MNRFAPLACAAALLLTASAARADVEQWNELGVKYDVSDDVSVTFDQHIRFDDDVSRLGAFMPELGAGYRPKKWIGFAVGYRLEYERDNDGEMRTHHRFFARIRPRYEVGKIRFDYRLQLQDTLRPDDPDDRWRQTVRNRLDVSYRQYKPWIPSASAETHNTIDQDFELEKIWLTAGVTYSKKKEEVEVFYRAELPQAEPMDPTVHILGLALHHDL
jgi:hypothetical protein